MKSLFLGLHAANLLLLLVTFILGLLAIDGDARPTSMYTVHLAMGIGAGLMATAAHIATYMYFMATTKWLHAATDKAGLDIARFVKPAAANKSRVFTLIMAAIMITMLTMFAGAGADPTMVALWPGEVHLVMAATTIAANLIAALYEYRYIGRQAALMDEALAILTPPPAMASPHQEKPA